MGNGTNVQQNKEGLGVPITRIETIAKGEIDLQRVGYANLKEVPPQFKLDDGDILFSHINSDKHLGKTAIFKASHGDVYHGINLLRIKLIANLITPEFFNLQCRHARNNGTFILNAQHAVNQSSLNQGRIKLLPLLLPPVEEQKRIVARIDSLSAKSRRVRDQLDHIPRLVEKYKQAILAATFNDASFAQWKQVRFEEFLTEAIVGLVRSKAQQSATGESPYIRMNHFDMEGTWNDDDLTFVKISPEELRRYELREGDVLFNTRNSFELVGKVAVWPANRPGCVYNNNLLRLRFTAQVNPHFAGLLMMSPAFRAYLQTKKSATTSVCAIYQRSLMQAPFAIPSLNEQHTIAQRVRNGMAWIDRLASEATSARKLMDHLDQAVLAKAFADELVPQDPNDEPASVLLERIRLERHTSSTQPVG